MKLHRSRLLFRCVFVALLLPVWPAVCADVVSFNFSGVFFSKEDPSGILGDAYKPGTAFMGSISYDPAAASADGWPEDPIVGLYGFAEAPAFSFRLWSGEHSLSAGKWGGLVLASDSESMEHLEYLGTISGIDGVELVSPFVVSGLWLNLNRNIAPFGGLDSDALPTSVPNLADFNRSTVAISIQDQRAGDNLFIYGEVLSLTPVPEPGTLALGLIGLGTLAVFASRRR